ncbi:HD domain-containing protein [Streptomyces zhihengii]|uniref:HD domain-containing protein n=1 Tax=Streptomyces zhihengii TaxID=1818004 RepID=UPI00339E2F5C
MLSVWAKHDEHSAGWLPLWRHMEDSAAVAERLWEEWLPLSVRRLISGVLPRVPEEPAVLVVAAIAEHYVRPLPRPPAQWLVAVGRVDKALDWYDRAAEAGCDTALRATVDQLAESGRLALAKNLQRYGREPNQLIAAPWYMG